MGKACQSVAWPAGGDRIRSIVVLVPKPQSSIAAASLNRRFESVVVLFSTRPMSVRPFRLAVKTREYPAAGGCAGGGGGAVVGAGGAGVGTQGGVGVGPLVRRVPAGLAQGVGLTLHD